MSPFLQAITRKQCEDAVDMVYQPLLGAKKFVPAPAADTWSPVFTPIGKYTMWCHQPLLDVKKSVPTSAADTPADFTPVLDKRQ